MTNTNPAAGDPLKTSRAPIIDLAERAAVIGLFLLLCYRLGADFLRTHHAVDLLFILGESLPVGLVVFRRPAQAVTGRRLDWLVTAAGTGLPLLVSPGGAILLNPLAGGSLMLAGFAFQIWGKLSLGRSYGLAPANRGVQAAGAYRLLRHPIYAGYIAMDSGFFLANANAWNAAVYALAYTAQMLRLLAEERLLACDPAYRAYSAQVRWRLFPGLF